MEKETLQLSGIQHYSFCPRQWALIHVEQQWQENLRTIDGKIFHQNADHGKKRESRGDLLIIRDLRVHSDKLNVSGTCDVIEFHRTKTGIQLEGEDGLWQPYPVEYKRGEPKDGNADQLQLCLQALCLEEMLCCDIPEGSLYYGETRHRERVAFDEALRNEVIKCTSDMNDCMEKGHTPKAQLRKACNACSLKDLCVPKLTKQKSVETYIQSALRDESV